MKTQEAMHDNFSRSPRLGQQSDARLDLEGLEVSPGRESYAGIIPAVVRRRCIAQHGELIQGQLQDHNQRRRRFLISLPCDRLCSTVTFAPVFGESLTVEPVHKTKIRKVVELTLEKVGFSQLGGTILVESNITEAKGYGSSTADCVAGALAAAAAVDRNLTEEEVAEVVTAAEIASDNLMFSRAVLFAHREGVVLEDLGQRLPRLEVLGIDTDMGGRVNTLDFDPATYDRRQIDQFEALVAGVRRAVRDRDLALLGRMATSSAVINEQFLPKPMFSELYRLAQCVNALGIAVAHSGTVLSFLFDPSDSSMENKTEQVCKELDVLGITNVLRFHT
jgi:uncharacterized protein involved in propanediol utilization